MKIEQTHIEAIRLLFSKMLTRRDLLKLLNAVKPLVYGENVKRFKLKQLTWYSNPKICGERYAAFSIKKKSGGERTIHAPVKRLKAIQKTLSFIFQCVFEPHKAALGFVRDKSIVDNAKLHINSKYVYNIDLKDFFPSIDQARVWKCLQLKPFNLIDENEGEEVEEQKFDTGIRMFTTNHEEKVYYQFVDGKLRLIGDNLGNFDRYVKRLTNHIKKPKVISKVRPKNISTSSAKAISMARADLLKKWKEHRAKVTKIVNEDASKYIYSAENMKELNLLIASRYKLANLIASLCCTEMEVERKNENGVWGVVRRNVLPQGAPTSPILTNVVCQRLDFVLSGVAKRFGLKYSRYADDITFSSMHNVYQTGSEFLKELHRIIEEQGFHIKASKTRLQKDDYRQEVTGLIVNDQVNVKKRYIKQLRMWLYYWERYGYDRAYSFFIQQYRADKGHIIKGRPNMENVIKGKLDYLMMVKGAENELFLKLKGRFNRLIGKIDPIEELLNVWETHGIDNAIDEYYKNRV